MFLQHHHISSWLLYHVTLPILIGHPISGLVPTQLQFPASLVGSIRIESPAPLKPLMWNHIGEIPNLEKHEQNSIVYNSM